MKKAYLAITSLALILTFVSLIIGVQKAPGDPKMIFLGRRTINSQDTPTYFSFIEQAKQGKILFQNLYTTEEPNPGLFRPSYLIIGQFGRIFNLSSPILFHLSRIPFGFLFFLTAYFFFSLFFTKKGHILTALSILAFSSGVGFITGGFIKDSTDLWIPESNTFLSLSDSPHFIFSQTLMLGIFTSFLYYLKTRSRSFLILGGLAAAILSFEHPFDLPTIFLAFGLFTSTFLLTKSKIPKNYLLISSAFLFPSLIGAVNYFFLLKSPAISLWSQQNVMLSPDFINYLSGFGFLLPLAVVGIIPLLKLDEEKAYLILSWLMSTFLLLYSPVVFQRRFIEGIHIPITILATLGVIFLLGQLERFFQKMRESKSKHKIYSLPAFVKPFIAIILILILSLTSLKSIYNDIQAFSNNKTDDYYYYLLPQEFEGMNWISKNIPDDRIILSNWFYGNLIPGFTGRKVYIGHKIQTIDFGKKNSFLADFFTTLSDQERKQFLKEQNINYLFFGKDDYFLRLGDFKAEEKNYLKKIYENQAVTIYSVNFK
ncbi:MAG: hypothetical protein Q8P91_01150 [bacterium]|nr:hypothetical protein [bacterium]